MSILSITSDLTERWQWSDPTWLRAWIWMLLQAHRCEKDGCVQYKAALSLAQIQDGAALSHRQARTFISKCVKQGDIERSASHSGRPSRDRIRVEGDTISMSITFKDNSWFYSDLSASDTIQRKTPKPQGESFQHDITLSLSDAVISQRDRIRVEGDTNNGGIFIDTTSCNQSENHTLFPENDTINDTIRGPKPKAVSKKKCTRTSQETEVSEPKTKQRTLLDDFHDLHLEHRGFKPHIAGARDMVILKRVRNTCGSDEEVRRRLSLFLQDALDWMAKPQWTLMVFDKCVDKYASGPDDKPQSIWG